MPPSRARVVGLAIGLIFAESDPAEPSGREWELEGLRNAAIQNSALCAEDLVDAIFASLDEFSQGRQSDDATVLVMRVR